MLLIYGSIIFFEFIISVKLIIYKVNCFELSNKISNFTYKNCDLIRGVHKEQTEILKNKYKKNTSVFPAWVDNTTFYPKNKNIKSNNILFVGNIIPRKGVLFLIKAFENFQINNDNLYQFKIVGDSPNVQYFQECKDYISKNNITNINFYGPMKPGEVAKIMNDSAILVMASNFEGLPRVLIESGLCKLPSLATNINGISSPFNSKGGTMLYEINNIKQFTKNLELFFNNNKKHTELATKAFQLSNSLSGSGVFEKNWKQIQETLYE